MAANDNRPACLPLNAKDVEDILAKAQSIKEMLEIAIAVAKQHVQGQRR
ncbi:hypothetical protein LVY75_33655 (plasmid) [Sinorhizobium sp. B11]|jgi:hypothetical protein